MYRPNDSLNQVGVFTDLEGKEYDEEWAYNKRVSRTERK